MKVFLTGATGFVGNAIAKKLLDDGHSVRALVRKRSESKFHSASKCEIADGDVSGDADLSSAMSGCDAVVHLVGIIKEFPSKGVTFDSVNRLGAVNVGNAAKKAQVKRFLHMSALGSRDGATTGYFKAKWAAEEHVRGLGLDLTVFRPSVIIGPGGEFTAILKQLCSAPMTPVIGDGNYKLQPVAMRDVVSCFVSALDKAKTVGKTYDIGGAEALSFNDMLKIFGEAMGRKTRLLHFPLAPMKLATRLFERVPGWPITSDQIAMLGESLVCDTRPMTDDLGVAPLPFREACVIALNEK